MRDVARDELGPSEKAANSSSLTGSCRCRRKRDSRHNPRSAHDLLCGSGKCLSSLESSLTPVTSLAGPASASPTSYNQLPSTGLSR